MCGSVQCVTNSGFSRPFPQLLRFCHSLLKAAKYETQKPSTCRATWANLLRDKLWVWWSNKAKICCPKQTRDFFFTPQQKYLLRGKLITQGEKCETSAQNLQPNNVALQIEGFCISYFAAFSSALLNVWKCRTPWRALYDKPCSTGRVQTFLKSLLSGSSLRIKVIFLPFCLLKALLSEKLQQNVSVPLPGGFVPEESGSQWTRDKWRASVYILLKPPYKLHEPVLRDQLPCKEKY